MIDFLKVNIDSVLDITILEYRIKKMLEKNFTNVPEVFLVAKELATNILKYGTKGYIEIDLHSDKITITAVDYGIKKDDTRYFDEKNKSLGLGLKIVRKNSDEFSFMPNEYGGITVKAVICLNSKSRKSFYINWGVAGRPHLLEEKSGDLISIKEVGKGEFLVLHADVLGHGLEANKLAEKIGVFFDEQPFTNLERFFLDLQHFIYDSRGCALFLALVSEYGLEYINIGNIRVWIIMDGKIRRLVEMPGIVGRNINRYKIFRENLMLHRVLLISCSDGVSSRFSPALLDLNNVYDIQVLAEDIAERFGVKNDDVSVLVLKGD
ncbi:hypothetical protein [Thermosyntropha sp.]|uniref:hypothetical protein n=1 Tax=Thermosyntropha sp. TaxID=2740820 RepID=UPI0025F08EC7|nr:hypothetical protein [Thermosyntropha sp.]MBO8158544.1 hypothetical protein [Thermosyntropha sp.]